MRFIWKGSISFGLINIPVGLVSAARDHELKITLLHKKDLSEIRYARICKEEEKEVSYTEIVRGIKSGDHYKILDPDDFKHAESEKIKTINIDTFCDAREVDSLYYEKPYFLEADREGAKAYSLLHKALEETGKVAIAEYVFKNHTHLAVIKPYKKLLVLNQMRYHSQIIDMSDLEKELDTQKLPEKEIDMAIMLIKQLSGHFDPIKYHDRYVENLEKIISKKTKILSRKKDEKKTKGAQVYDLMALLKASLKPTNTQKKKKKAA